MAKKVTRLEAAKSPVATIVRPQDTWHLTVSLAPLCGVCFVPDHHMSDCPYVILSANVEQVIAAPSPSYADIAHQNGPACPAAPSLLNNNNSEREKRTMSGADLPPQTALVKLTPRLAKSDVMRKNLCGSENHQETETNQGAMKIDTTTTKTITIVRNAGKIAVVKGSGKGGREGAAP